MALEFEFQEIDREISALEVLAANYLDPSGPTVLDRARETLRQIRRSHHYEAQAWTIPVDAPLRSKVSEGRFEPAAKSGPPVFAELSSKWEIAPIPRKRRKYGDVKEFRLSGIASSRIAIRSGSPDNPGRNLSIWRMEIADDNSPGCYFHVQIADDEPYLPGDDGDALCYPKWLPVPRIPIFLATPLLAFEFALGELFQDDWPRELARESTAAQDWRPIQRRRLMSLLRWQHGVVRDEQGSPWLALKKLLPPADLFISGEREGRID